MSKKKTLNPLISLFIIIFIPALICLFWGFPFIKNGHQVFKDFVVGEIALYADNKTGEWIVTWVLILLSVILSVVCANIYRKSDGKEKEDIESLERISLLSKLKSSFADHLVILFSLWGLVTAFSMFMGKNLLNSIIVLLVSIMLFGVFGIIKIKESYKSFLLIPIPLLLTVYLKNRYEYGGSIVRLGQPAVFKLFILLMIALCYVDVFFAIKKNLRERKYNIPFSVCFSVFSFLSSTPAALIEQTDLHHHGEQILPFMQIFMMGSKAYEEYYPSSGLYPVPLGFINHILFNDRFTCYSLSYIIFMNIFMLILSYLLYRRLKGTEALILMFFIHMPVYCRTWILPIGLLLLSDRALIKRRFLWICAYVCTCFIAGLYYPIFGFALLVGILPYFIIHFVLYLRGCADKEEKQIGMAELIFASILGTVIVLSIPFLFRMFKHIMSMSSQSMAAESMAVMGKELPDFFLPFLSKISEINRVRLYYFIRLYLPVPFVGAFVYLSLRMVNENGGVREFFSDFTNRKRGAFLLSTSIPITLCITYIYTLLCMDEEWVSRLLSRASHVIVLLCCMTGFVLLSEFKSLLRLNRLNTYLKLACLLIPLIFFLRQKDYSFPRITGMTGEDDLVLYDYDGKLDPYPVSDDFLPADDNLFGAYPGLDKERFGQGFVKASNVYSNADLKYKLDYLRTYDPSILLIGNEESQGNYYLLNEKCVYSGRVTIAKGRDAVSVLLSKIDKDHTVIRPTFYPLLDYYLYRFIADNGYVYDGLTDLFIPGKLYEKIYGMEGSLYDSPFALAVNCFDVPKAFGESMESMECLEKVGDGEIISDDRVGDMYFCDILTPESLYGRKGEFLYIEINDNENLDKDGHMGGIKQYIPEKMPVFTVTWDDMDNAEYKVYGFLSGNKLLIPLGANADWLLRFHTNINISVDGYEGDLHVTNAGFYSLKDI